MIDPTYDEVGAAEARSDELMRDVAPLIAALQAQLASCEKDGPCAPCNQARAALAEFLAKYPQ